MLWRYFRSADEQDSGVGVVSIGKLKTVAVKHIDPQPAMIFKTHATSRLNLFQGF